MIKNLWVYTASTAPWWYNYKGYTISQSYRAYPLRILGFALERLCLCFGYIVDRSINTSGTFPWFRITRIRSCERRNMIKITIIFIISENKNCFLPYLRIFCQNIQHFRNVPRSIPWSARMIGKIFRRYQPGYRRQISFLNIVSKLMQDVSFRNFHFPFCTIIVII